MNFNMHPNLNQIFICYAREDEDIATTIFKELENSNLNPWMDQFKLQIGDNWKLLIKNKIERSPFIVVLLSENSINKNSFLQQEYQWAIELHNRSTESNPYHILPIKIDNCKTPYLFNERFHVTKYNPTFPIKDIITKIGDVKKLFYKLNPQLNESPNYSISKVFSLDSIANEYVESEIKYPHFYHPSTFDLELLNTTILSYIYTFIDVIERSIEDLINGEMTLRDNMKYMFYLDYDISIINQNYISILFYEYYDYYGVHPNNYYKSINIKFNRNRILSEFDFENLDHLEELINNHLQNNEDCYSNKLNDLIGFEDVLQAGRFEFYLKNENIIQIILSNHLPRASQSCGIFEFNYTIKNDKIVLLP